MKKWSKLKRVLLSNICFIFLIGAAGCSCKSNDGDQTTPKENLTEAQLYNQFKVAYTNRKLYKSDFTQGISSTIKTSTSGANFSELKTSEKMTYNSQTGEGYIILESDLLDDTNSKTYVLKESDEYIMYYSQGEDMDLFYTDKDYLMNEINDNYTHISEYITAENPNSYTTINKYIDALKGNLAEELSITSESIIVKYSLKENAYSDYSLDIDFSLTTPAIKLEVEMDVDFDKSTINSFDYEKDLKSSESTNVYQEILDVEFNKNYDNKGMNFDKTSYLTELPGTLVIANIDLDLSSGFATIGSNFTKKVKAGAKINETLSSIIEKYSDEENIFLGWFYDEGYISKVTDNDVFSDSTIDLYGKIGTKTYNITNVQSDHGTYINYENAIKGQTLYITTFPDTGYVVSEMYYIEEGSSTKHYFTNSFVMPNKNITIYVIFGDTINIRTKEELLTHLQNPDNWDKNFKLMNDINLNNAEWTPIGTSLNPFSGTFDGNKYTISNLTITNANYNENNGFFSILSGSVKNLGLKNINISYRDNDFIVVGAMAGSLYDGSIENCYVSGTISVTSDIAVYAGGLVGATRENSQISNSYSNVSISTQSSSYDYLSSCGGLVGLVYDDISISNSYATGKVCVSGVASSFAGGIIGYISDSHYINIRNSYATGNMTAINSNSSSTSMAGGLIGYGDITVTNCYRYENQQVASTKNRINQTGTSASMSEIYQFVYNNWDHTIWNISSTSNPTLK